jgi:hypothetical protein
VLSGDEWSIVSLVNITSDPAASLERIYERIYETERMVAHYEAAGLHFCAAAERRRLSGLRSARTRYIHILSSMRGE